MRTTSVHQCVLILSQLAGGIYSAEVSQNFTMAGFEFPPCIIVLFYLHTHKYSCKHIIYMHIIYMHTNMQHTYMSYINTTELNTCIHTYIHFYIQTKKRAYINTVLFL